MADEPLFVEFMGEQFAMSDRIGVMPLMRFAKTAAAGTQSNDMAGLVALYDLLEQCIDPADWPRFEQHAMTSRADSADLMQVTTTVFRVLSGRPTKRPSDSSDGPQRTEASSTAGSSSPAIRLLTGRPDLQAVVAQAEAATA